LSVGRAAIGVIGARAAGRLTASPLEAKLVTRLDHASP